MYKLKLAVRSLLGQRTGTLINAIGLSLSLAVCLIIALYVQYEYSFEKHNPDAKNVYRLLNVHKGERDPIHPIVFFDKLTAAIPELDEGLMLQLHSTGYFTIDNKQIFLDRVMHSTNAFFPMFNIRMLEGGDVPLTDAFSAVISKSEAEKLFPGTSAIGKTIRYRNNHDFTITGVYEDVPITANYRPNIVLNIHAQKTTDYYQYTSMNNQSTSFFFRLPENADKVEIAQKIEAEALKAYGKDFSGTYAFQPLTDIHLRSSDTTWDTLERSDEKVVQLFIIVAALVLLIALFNFINLSVALRNKRNFNTGMQKIMGAGARDIFGYLFTETTILVTICVLIALILTSTLLPYFSNLMGVNTEFSLANPLLWGAILSIAVTTILLPVLVQWRHQMRITPSATIKGRGRILPKRGKISLAQTLTIMQIAISICLIIGVIGINKQFDLMLNKKLGFDKENLVTILNPPTKKTTADRYALYKQELERLPFVSGVTGTMNTPGHTLNNGTTIAYEDAGEKQQLNLRIAPTDGDFFDVMKTKFILGEAYSPTDSSKIVINEQCWKKMNVENPIGMKVTSYFTGLDCEICGVIEDIQNISLQNESFPAFYFLYLELWYFIVRLHPGDLQKNIAEMEAVWKRIEPDLPFSYSFVDKDLQANYTREIRTRKLLTIMSLLAIFISMLGLYGLSMQIIQHKTKEIGIRKINGATISEILALLNRRFIIWVIIAFIIAVPITYYAISKWLENFAYKTSLNWWIFALAGLIALLVALLTVSWQSWRAASRNPVEALRYE